MKHKGFTLVEMVVVLGILGILLSIGVPGFVQSVDRSREMERAKHEEMINMGIRQYYAIELKYPISGSESPEELKDKLNKLRTLHYIDLEDNSYTYSLDTEAGKNPPIIKVNFK